MSNELKPCPFCGAIAQIENRTEYDVGYETYDIVCCTLCDGEMNNTSGREDTISAWNERTDTLERKLEAMQGAIDISYDALENARTKDGSAHADKGLSEMNRILEEAQ